MIIRKTGESNVGVNVLVVSEGKCVGYKSSGISVILIQKSQRGIALANQCL